jgi:type III secretion system FlhB-like substrate exporter
MKHGQSSYKLAVGLHYDRARRDIPVVGASGECLAADQMVKLARRYGVPVVERPALARALADCGLDKPIPESLFEAVSGLLFELDRHLF